MTRGQTEWSFARLRDWRSAYTLAFNADMTASLWQDLSWPEFRRLPPETVAVLPVGAIEQHGPHAAGIRR